MHWKLYNQKDFGARPKLAWMLGLLLTALLFQPEISLASPNNKSSLLFFNDQSFKQVWQRLDKPVLETVQAGRGYTWGNALPGSQKVVSEIYNGLPRKVQYFDKARMEITNPTANPQNSYYVTTGLLVAEMVSGSRQDGDSSFVKLPPNPIQVAGDSNLGGGNPLAPTYASFKTVINAAIPESNQVGLGLKNRIDRAGVVSPIEPPEARLIENYDAVTHHNIADVFGEFGRRKGSIWDGRAFSQVAALLDNPTAVLGRPITEPYWARATVGGVEKDVLVQLFERRVLTYTPSNPDPYKVEMGNVGQHYYTWRYVLNRSSALPNPKAFTTRLSSAIPFKGQGTVLDQSFFSPALKKDLTYRVYLPPGYSYTNTRFPVLYMLHGLGGSYQDWFNLGLFDAADHLIQTGAIKPFIIVLPEGEQGYWLNHVNGGPRWGDYLVVDLINYIDASYRTLNDSNHRAIGGISMGAHGALQLGFNFPGIFGIMGAHSPALRTKAQAFDYWGDDEYYAGIDPVSLAQTKNLTGYRLWLDIGEEDGKWLPRVQEFHQVLQERGVEHSWNVWPGGHNEKYWTSHCQDYLNFYNRAFTG